MCADAAGTASAYPVLEPSSRKNPSGNESSVNEPSGAFILSHQETVVNPTLKMGGGTIAEIAEANTEATRSAAGGADARRGSEGVALGNNAKRPAIQQIRGFQPHPEDLDWTRPDPETGETTPFLVTVNHKREAVAKTYKTPQTVRSERWALKSVANELLPGTRVSKCHRIRAKNQGVCVCCGNDSGKAFFTGLQTCGSVWGCPLCAAKISERRRAELVKAIQQAVRLSLHTMLVTLTIPHGLGDDVAAITDKLIKAWDSVKRNRAGREVLQLLGQVGTIRSMEVTYGENGFHPHLHILLFVDKPVTPFQVQFLLAPIWQKACVKQGLPKPSDKHGCKVDDGSKAAAYCSKWGIESEMTRGHTKTAAQGKGMTPWDMLRAVLHDNDEQAGKLFQVYYEAFKGRRQLCWSKGLKDLLAVADLTDEEIAAQEQETSTELARLTPDQWRAIYKTKSEPLILDIAEKAPDKLDDVIRMIQARHESVSPAYSDQARTDDNDDMRLAGILRFRRDHPSKRDNKFGYYKPPK
jgi:hypothetical protein